MSSTDGEAFAAREDVSAGLAESEIIKDLEGELSNTQLELGSTQKQIVELDDQLRHAKSQSETASSSMAALEGDLCSWQALLQYVSIVSPAQNPARCCASGARHPSNLDIWRKC